MTWAQMVRTGQFDVKAADGLALFTWGTWVVDKEFEAKQINLGIKGLIYDLALEQ